MEHTRVSAAPVFVIAGSWKAKCEKGSAHFFVLVLFISIQEPLDVLGLTS